MTTEHTQDDHTGTTVPALDASALERLLERRDDVRLLDVLSDEHYATVHLPGAESIPRAELEHRAPGELDRHETIVVYCASDTCSASPKAARTLIAMGYTDVHDFEGGIAEWRGSGRPVWRAGDDAS